MTIGAADDAADGVADDDAAAVPADGSSVAENHCPDSVSDSAVDDYNFADKSLGCAEVVGYGTSFDCNRLVVHKMVHLTVDSVSW